MLAAIWRKAVLVPALGLAFLGMLRPGQAEATALGLTVGDTISQFEWDALQSVSGDGGFFRTALGAKGGFYGDGRINSLDLTDTSTIVQTNVDLRFDVDLLSQILLGGPNIYDSSASFGGAGAVNPDFVIKENGINILWGDLSANFTVVGNVNVLDANPQSLTGTAKITLLGGDAALLAALGGSGGQANLFLSASVFGFSPPLNSLASDGNMFNSDFNVSLTGILTPLNASAFTPEPSSALLVATGMLGLLALSRRRRIRG